jgi:hypothetical protein
MRCDRASRVSPPTVLFNGVATPVPRARECQARARGSTRPLCATLATGSGARAGVQSTAQGSGINGLEGPRRFKDAVEPDVEHAQLRLIPGVSREVSGSPALLPSPWRPCSIAKAAVCLRI